MALAAFIAMIHDLLVTIGIYSLAGFQVTPDTVIAVLTILGYSLYDTVVVFDRVRDNTKGFGASGRMTYSEMINLSMNQTLARSINTSLVAILPVLAVLVVGAEILGATTLQDYGLALTVGLLSGAYSSIFIASPVLAMLKEREPRYVDHPPAVGEPGRAGGVLTPAAAAALGPPGCAAASRPGGRRPQRCQPAGLGAPAPARPPVGPSQREPRRRRDRRPASGGPLPGRAATAVAGAEVGDGRPAATRPTGARRPPPRPRHGGRVAGGRKPRGRASVEGSTAEALGRRWPPDLAGERIG